MRRISIVAALISGIVLLATILTLAISRHTAIQPVMYFQAAGTGNLYQMNADGSDLKLLLTNYYGFETPLQWSPRGAWGILALLDQNRLQSLYRMRPDGSQRRPIPNTSGINEFAWSSDGHWIVYATSYNTQLGRIRPDGSHQQVPLNPSFSNALEVRSFSDNQFIVRGTHQSFGQRTYLIRLDGSVVEWMDLPDPNLVRLRSPNERWMVFSSGLRDKYNIFRAKAGGFSTVQLTHLFGDERFATWSPDSQWIIFTSETSRGKKFLYRMRWDGTGIRQLTPQSFVQDFQTFSPDGRWIYFDARTSDGFAMYRVPINGDNLEQLTSGFDNPLIFSSWSPQFDRNGSVPLLLVLSLVLLGGGLCVAYYSSPR